MYDLRIKIHVDGFRLILYVVFIKTGKTSRCTIIIIFNIIINIRPIINIIFINILVIFIS